MVRFSGVEVTDGVDGEEQAIEFAAGSRSVATLPQIGLPDQPVCGTFRGIHEPRG
jgi:hypothetical protein